MSQRAHISRAVTLREVAEAAGVAKSTASDALSGRGRMTETTRQHIARLAAELGYVPNSTARNLRLARTGAIGMHILDRNTLSSSYVLDFLSGAAERTHVAGLDLTLLAARDSIVGRDAIRADGIIIADPLGDDRVAMELLDSDLLVVSGEACPVGHSATATVMADHRGGLNELLAHLVERGASTVALIAVGEYSGWGVELQATYLDWCTARRVEPLQRVAPYFAAGDPKLLTAVVVELLSEHPEVDALILPSVQSYPALMAATTAVGRVIGEDLLVAGTADSQFPQAEVAMTALDLHPQQLGYECAEVLINLIQGVQPDSPIRRIPATLNRRGSTGS